jgi:hypothetical protein
VRAYYSPAMEAARPPRRRRRPRRGTVDSPVNGRLVRVAAVVVAPALLALLFSISTTGTLPRPPLEPLFDASAAAVIAAQLSAEHPSRVPGTPEAEEAAGWYEGTISELGLHTEVQTWTVTLPDLGEVELRNVIAVVPGRSEESIVLVAHRDNRGADGSGDNASGTAALIELARGYGAEGTAPAPMPQRTLVFVSTDAGAFGGAGARHFARESPYAHGALAAVVLDGIGGGGAPRLAIAAGRPASPARALVSTASARVAEHVGELPLLPSVATQLVDLALPLGVGEQGHFLALDIAALTLTTQEPGEPGVPVGDPGASPAHQRLGQLGRATEALVGSLDGSVGGRFGTPDGVFFGNRVASGWALRLTLIAAVAPFVLGIVDLLARARRRRLPLGPAVRALRARCLFWLFAGLLLWVGAITGAFPTGAPLPLSPYSASVVDQPGTGLALLAAVLALGWLVGRRRLIPSRPSLPEETLAGTVVGLAWLGLVALAAALTKPYAIVFLLPSLYAWLWLPLVRRALTRGAVYVAGLAGPVAGLLLLAHGLGLDPLEALVYLASLVTVGYLSVWSVVLALGWAAAAAQLGTIALGRYAPYADGAVSPPPGVIRSTVGAIGRRARKRRYARAT